MAFDPHMESEQHYLEDDRWAGEPITRLAEDEVPWIPCDSDAAACDLGYETEGYEETAREVFVCRTHGVYRDPVPA